MNLNTHKALIQNLRQEKQNLEIVNTRLINQNDQEKQAVQHLTQINQQYAAEVLDLQSHISNLQFQISRLSQNQQSQQQHDQEIQNLERKLIFLETQHNGNLQMVYAQLEEEKQKNERLQQRIRESKTKTQILAYSQLDSAEHLQKQLTQVTLKLQNATTLIESMNQLVHERETALQLATKTNENLTAQVEQLQGQLKQRNLYLDELRSHYEMEMNEKDMTIKRTQDQAINHVRTIKQRIDLDQSQEIYFSDKENDFMPNRQSRGVLSSGRSKRAYSGSKAVIKHKAAGSSKINLDLKSVAEWSQNDTDKFVILNNTATSHIRLANNNQLKPSKLATVTKQWLKQMLLEAWQRELHLKRFIQDVCDSRVDTLELQIQVTERQTAKVKAEVERWQMRNEEMEQLLQKSQSQCWHLKQIIIEQQSAIKATQLERRVYAEQLSSMWDQSRSTLNFAEFEMRRLSEIIMRAGVVQGTLGIAQDCLQIIAQAQSKQLDAEDHLRQCQAEIEDCQRQNAELREKVQALDGESVYLQELLQSQKEKYNKDLLKLYECLDPNSTKPDPRDILPQFYKLIDDYKLKLNDCDLRIESILISHAEEIQQIQKLNDELRQKMNQFDANRQSQPIMLIPRTIGTNQTIQTSQLHSQTNSQPVIAQHEQVYPVVRSGQASCQGDEGRRSILELENRDLTQKVIQLQNQIENITRQSNAMTNRQSSQPEQYYNREMSREQQVFSFRGSSSIEDHKKKSTASLEHHNYQEEQYSETNEQEQCQNIKSSLFDMISIVKDTWEPSPDLKKQYDNMIKEMMMMQSDSVIDLTQVLANLVLTIHQHVELRNEHFQKVVNDLQEMKNTDSNEERDIKRNLDIVVQVFSKAANKLVGLDRDWQQVLDSQVYVLEEVLESSSKKDRRTGQTCLEMALNDFTLTIERTMEQFKPSKMSSLKSYR